MVASGRHRRVSSTVSAACYTPEKHDELAWDFEPPPSNSRRQGRRSVRFDLQHNQEYESAASASATTATWYSASELQTFREQQRFEATHSVAASPASLLMMQQQQQEQQKQDDEHYDHHQQQRQERLLLQQQAQAYRQVVKSLHQACHMASVNNGGTYPSLSWNDCRALTADPELLGLERWMKRLRRDKAARLEEMRRCIRQVTLSFVAPQDLPTTSRLDAALAMQAQRQQHDEEWIRWHCERISLPSRLFAYHMAAAQQSEGC